MLIKVIPLDSDVILMDDIEKMWKLFDQFGSKAVGLFLGKRGPQFNEESLSHRVFLTDVRHGPGTS